LTHVDSQHTILIKQELSVISNEKQPLLNLFNDEENIILPEKIDLKDLNPYEPSLSQLLIHNQSEVNEININKYSYEDNQSNQKRENVNSLFISHLSLFDVEYCIMPKSLLHPQFVLNHVESINCFQ
jgi:hypothetical protein